MQKFPVSTNLAVRGTGGKSTHNQKHIGHTQHQYNQQQVLAEEKHDRSRHDKQQVTYRTNDLHTAGNHAAFS
ncbi:MAG: hypothetical protein JMHAAFGB_01027 [Dehalococcoides mccartyi]|nr:hypothetical protein [Dehalococcoides mccartyi]